MYERLPQELKAHAGFCGWKYEQRGSGIFLHVIMETL